MFSTKMAALRKFGRLSSVLFARNTRLYCTSSSRPPPNVLIEDKPPWPEEWMPNKHPKTEEERRKSAEYYGLHPDEYQPYTEEHGVGDYPKLPYIGYDARDPYYPWDIPALRRNYNEVLHEDEDVMGSDRYSSYGVKEHENDTFDGLVGIAVFLVLIVIIFYQGEPHHRVMAKQYIDEDLHEKRYTFEPLK